MVQQELINVKRRAEIASKVRTANLNIRTKYNDQNTNGLLIVI